MEQEAGHTDSNSGILYSNQPSDSQPREYVTTYEVDLQQHFRPH